MTPEVPFFDLGALVRARRGEIDAAIADVIDSGMFVGGPMVSTFEEAFASYLGVAHCVALGNGLDALRLGLECAGIGPGNEVIVPGFTFYATWLAVLQTGATPVPVDVDEATASIDIDLVEDAITERTRAVLPVHLYGIPVDVARLGRIADRHGLVVLEDVAQAHGARDREGLLAGSRGHGAAFSFYPTKNLGALGDAGALVTHDGEWAARARSRRSYGQGATKYDHVDTGWNSRMDPLQASLLLRGLSHLDADNARRADIAGSYRAALSDVLHAVIAPAADERSAWHHFVVRASRREELRAWLHHEGIGTDVHYPYAFADLPPTAATLRSLPDLPASSQLAQSVVSLPMGPWMTDRQVDIVAEALRRVPRELLLGV